MECCQPWLGHCAAKLYYAVEVYAASHQSDLMLSVSFALKVYVLVQEPGSIVCSSKRFQKLAPTCGTVQGNWHANIAH